MPSSDFLDVRVLGLHEHVAPVAHHPLSPTPNSTASKQFLVMRSTTKGGLLIGYTSLQMSLDDIDEARNGLLLKWNDAQDKLWSTWGFSSHQE